MSACECLDFFSFSLSFQGYKDGCYFYILITATASEMLAANRRVFLVHRHPVGLHDCLPLIISHSCFFSSSQCWQGSHCRKLGCIRTGSTHTHAHASRYLPPSIRTRVRTKARKRLRVGCGPASLMVFLLSDEKLVLRFYPSLLLAFLSVSVGRPTSHPPRPARGGTADSFVCSSLYILYVFWILDVG